MSYRSYLDSFLLPFRSGAGPDVERHNTDVKNRRQALKRKFTEPGEPGRMFRRGARARERGAAMRSGEQRRCPAAAPCAHRMAVATAAESVSRSVQPRSPVASVQTRVASASSLHQHRCQADACCPDDAGHCAARRPAAAAQACLGRAWLRPGPGAAGACTSS